MMDNNIKMFRVKSDVNFSIGEDFYEFKSGELLYRIGNSDILKNMSNEDVYVCSDIYDFCLEELNEKDTENTLKTLKSMSKKTYIITAGGTSEYIDTVRKITNTSSGKLGKLIAEEILKSNPFAEVFYIHAYGAETPSNGRAKLIPITTTNDLKEAVESLLKSNKTDAFIHCMAVSDYSVKEVIDFNKLKASILNCSYALDEDGLNSIITECKIDNSSKMSSKNGEPAIILKDNPKIISLIKELSPETFLVGFKLLNDVKEEHLFDVAYNLLCKNKCNLVIANDLKLINDGNHTGLFVYPDKTYSKIQGKEFIAKELVLKLNKDLFIK